MRKIGSAIQTFFRRLQAAFDPPMKATYKATSPWESKLSFVCENILHKQETFKMKDKCIYFV